MSENPDRFKRKKKENNNSLSFQPEKSPTKSTEVSIRIDDPQIEESNISVDPTHKKIFEVTQTFYVNTLPNEELSEEEEILSLRKLSKNSLERIVQLMGMEFLEIIDYSTIKIVIQTYQESMEKINKNNVIEIQPEHKRLIEYVRLYNIISAKSGPYKVISDKSIKKILSLMGLHSYEVLNYAHYYVTEKPEEVLSKESAEHLPIMKRVSMNKIQVIEKEEVKTPNQVVLNTEDSDTRSNENAEKYATLIEDEPLKEENEAKVRKGLKAGKKVTYMDDKQEEVVSSNENVNKIDPNMFKRANRKKIVEDKPEEEKPKDEYEEVEDRDNIKRFIKKNTLKNALEWQEAVDKDGEVRLVKKIVPSLRQFMKKGSAVISYIYGEDVEVIDEDGNTLKVKPFLLSEKNRVKDREGDLFQFINTEGEMVTVRRKPKEVVVEKEALVEEINTAPQSAANDQQHKDEPQKEEIKQEEAINLQEQDLQTTKDTSTFVDHKELLDCKVIYNNRILAERLNKEKNISIWEDVSFFDDSGYLHQDGQIVNISCDVDSSFNLSICKSKTKIKPIIKTEEGFRLYESLQCEDAKGPIVVNPANFEERKAKEILIKKKLYICLLYPVYFYILKIRDAQGKNSDKEITILNRDNMNNVSVIEGGKSYLEMIDKNSKEVLFKLAEDLFTYYYNISDYSILLEDPAPIIRLNELHSDIRIIKKAFANVVNINYLHNAWTFPELSNKLDIGTFNHVAHIRNISKNLLLRKKVEPEAGEAKISYKEFMFLKDKLTTI